MEGEALWLFGYGSLIWRPDFAFERRSPGWVHGWERRFWQGSTDHRGVPGAPGRVVTLVPSPAGTCWGMAYRLVGARVADVMASLDRREQGGYERLGVDVHTKEEGMVHALVYVATPSNPNYLGPAPVQAIAAQVARARGPSGPNAEYVVRLADALRAMGADDPHVFTIERSVVTASQGGSC